MNYKLITTDRQFKDTTSYDRKSFNLLLEDMERTYHSLHGRSYETYIDQSVTEPPKLPTLGDALFFVLFQMKNDLVFGSLGAVFGMSGGIAHRNFQYFSNLLEQTLKKRRSCPNDFLRQ